MTHERMYSLLMAYNPNRSDNGMIVVDEFIDNFTTILLNYGGRLNYCDLHTYEIHIGLTNLQFQVVSNFIKIMLTLLMKKMILVNCLL